MTPGQEGDAGKAGAKKDTGKDEIAAQLAELTKRVEAAEEKAAAAEKRADEAEAKSAEQASTIEELDTKLESGLVSELKGGDDLGDPVEVKLLEAITVPEEGRKGHGKVVRPEDLKDSNGVIELPEQLADRLVKLGVAERVDSDE